MTRFTALVVDDNMVNLVLASGLLRQLGGVVHTADSGAKAVEMARRTDFEIVFLDHLMPEMDGVETARRLREVRPNIPIVALTAGLSENIRDYLLSHGFNDFVAKPLMADDLRNTLARYLPGREPSGSVPGDAPSKAVRAALDGIAELDVSAAVEVCDGSWPLYREVARSFADTIPATLDRMRSLLARGDYKEAQIEFHALRAALSNAGAYTLAKLSDKLEKGCNDNPPDYVTRNGGRFLDAVGTLARRLDAALTE